MRFNLDRLPIKVEKCPITEAIIEIRFEPNIPVHEIHAIVFEKFSASYPNRSTYNFGLAEEILESNNAFRYNPRHSFQNNDLILNFGKHIFTIINYETLHRGYLGWDKFSTKTQEIFSVLFAKGVIKSLERASIRYVDFFENLDIFERINLNFNPVDGANLEKASQENILFRNEFSHDDFKHIISISNNAEYANLKGSCIDLDIIKDSDVNENNLFEIIEKGHKLEKELFFGLLKADFLESLKPLY